MLSLARFRYFGVNMRRFVDRKVSRDFAISYLQALLWDVILYSKRLVRGLVWLTIEPIGAIRVGVYERMHTRYPLLNWFLAFLLMPSKIFCIVAL